MAVKIKPRGIIRYGIHKDEIHTGVEKIVDESVNVSDEAIQQIQEGGDAE